MGELNFTSYKYNHGRAQPISRGQVILLTVAVMLIPIAFILFVPFGICVTIMLIAIFFKSRKSLLCIAPRFLTCGPTILYYRNITKIVLQKEPGQLTLFCGDESLRITQDKFPTGARKPDKIKANTEAKFKKVSDRIIGKVLKVTPDVKLVGIDRAAVLADIDAARPGGKA
jgi:hypothetical protein